MTAIGALADRPLFYPSDQIEGPQLGGKRTLISPYFDGEKLRAILIADPG